MLVILRVHYGHLQRERALAIMFEHPVALWVWTPGRRASATARTSMLQPVLRTPATLARQLAYPGSGGRDASQAGGGETGRCLISVSNRRVGQVETCASFPEGVRFASGLVAGHGPQV